jgi:hypothetical protein
MILRIVSILLFVLLLLWLSNGFGNNYKRHMDHRMAPMEMLK